jgi:hypothetical protein
LVLVRDHQHCGGPAGEQPIGVVRLVDHEAVWKHHLILVRLGQFTRGCCSEQRRQGCRHHEIVHRRHSLSLLADQ